jgi:hypothetical protein
MRLAGTMPCSGARDTVCGGPNVSCPARNFAPSTVLSADCLSSSARCDPSVALQALVIFTTDASPAPTTPSQPTGPVLAAETLAANGWATDGRCIRDNANGRLLQGPSKVDSLMTYAMCTDFCFGQGFQVAGLE